MTVAGSSVLVTGANRGIGQALVEEALRRGARRVYAGTRRPFTHADERVTPLALDVTDPGQIQGAVEQIGSLDILINNAGLALHDDLTDRQMLERHLAVNLFGTWGVTQAFVPSLTVSRGAVVNVVSLAALTSVPSIPAYSISKAAAFSLTQSLRLLLAGQGIRVHAVLPGVVDTDMVRALNVPKADIPTATAESVAQAIFDGVDNGAAEIFPDPLSAALAEKWRSWANALDRAGQDPQRVEGGAAVGRRSSRGSAD